jgi:hypothetical protein
VLALLSHLSSEPLDVENNYQFIYSLNISDIFLAQQVAFEE